MRDINKQLRAYFFSSLVLFTSFAYAKHRHASFPLSKIKVSSSEQIAIQETIGDHWMKLIEQFVVDKQQETEGMNLNSFDPYFILTDLEDDTFAEAESYLNYDVVYMNSKRIEELQDYLGKDESDSSVYEAIAIESFPIIVHEFTHLYQFKKLKENFGFGKAVLEDFLLGYAELQASMVEAIAMEWIIEKKLSPQWLPHFGAVTRFEYYAYLFGGPGNLKNDVYERYKIEAANDLISPKFSLNYEKRLKNANRHIKKIDQVLEEENEYLEYFGLPLYQEEDKQGIVEEYNSLKKALYDIEALKQFAKNELSLTLSKHSRVLALKTIQNNLLSSSVGYCPCILPFEYDSDNNEEFKKTYQSEYVATIKKSYEEGDVDLEYSKDFSKMAKAFRSANRKDLETLTARHGKISTRITSYFLQEGSKSMFSLLDFHTLAHWLTDYDPQSIDEAAVERIKLFFEDIKSFVKTPTFSNEEELTRYSMEVNFVLFFILAEQVGLDPFQYIDILLED